MKVATKVSENRDSIGGIFNQILKNSGKLLSSSVIAQAMGFASMIISARVLGPQEYGLLAIGTSYVTTIGSLLSFQLWQAIIKYGIKALEEGSAGDLKSIIKLSLFLDVSVALISFIIAKLISGLIISSLHWDTSLYLILNILCWSLLVNITGTPIGILRIFNRFDLLSVNNVISGVIKLIGVGWCLLTKQGLEGFAWAYLITVLLSQGFLFITTGWVLYQKKLSDFLFASLTEIDRRFLGIKDYIWIANFHLTIRMLSREADLLFISAFVLPEAVGYFKLAKQIASIFGIIIDPFYQTIYPELTKLWNKNDIKTFIKIINQVTFIASVFGIICWIGIAFFGKPVVVFVLGISYLPVFDITIVYLIAVLLSVSTFALSPAMLAIGKVRQSLYINIIATVGYFIILIPMLRIIGIQGAAIAYICYYIIWGVLISIFLYKLLSTSKRNSMFDIERE